jgi:hypothetical protein
LPQEKSGESHTESTEMAVPIQPSDNADADVAVRYVSGLAFIAGNVRDVACGACEAIAIFQETAK